MTIADFSVAVPSGAELPLDDLAAWARTAPVARPFASDTIAGLVAIGKELHRSPVARAHAEVQALAFWLREAPLGELARAVQASWPADVVVSPRGSVFHVPPGNVDTVFVYSWALAALAGNRNVVRLPTGSDEVVEGICDVLSAVLHDPAHAALAARTRFVRYGHDEDVTRKLSSWCDVRVLWGGDATVTTLRALPIPAHATEVTFPDRYALCVLDIAAVAALDARELEALADRFVSDAYWFDQMACSSPRLVVWRGPHDDDATAESFFEAVRAATRRAGYEAPLSAVLAKVVHGAVAAATEPVDQVRRFGNEVVVLDLAELDGFARGGPGGGLFYTTRVRDLGDLAEHLTRRDQTVTHFGFDAPDLRAFAEHLNGRGVDRIVPVGRALALHRFWDGFDLIAAFTRLTHVEVGR